MKCYCIFWFKYIFNFSINFFLFNFYLFNFIK
jgi:hypothetical protein